AHSSLLKNHDPLSLYFPDPRVESLAGVLHVSVQPGNLSKSRGLPRLSQNLRIVVGVSSDDRVSHHKASMPTISQKIPKTAEHRLHFRLESFNCSSVLALVAKFPMTADFPFLEAWLVHAQPDHSRHVVQVIAVR